MLVAAAATSGDEPGRASPCCGLSPFPTRGYHVKAVHAGAFTLAAVFAIVWAPTATAQEATTNPTTTEQSTTEPTTIDPTTTTTAPAPDPWAETARTRRIYRRAMWFKLAARSYTNLMRRDRQRVNRTKSEFRTLLGYRLWLRRAWRLRLYRARFRAHHPPHLAEWLCIHRYEGAWRDPTSPYYGGLQMDLSFQRTYGASLLRRKGTAEHWAPYEQMWVAERALRAGRGFSPWPLTARRCGLI
jgi:hypothetical protein